jgi:hypothetical protein
VGVVDAAADGVDLDHLDAHGDDCLEATVAGRSWV